MAEKIGFGDAKKNSFSEQMGFRKKSIEKGVVAFSFSCDSLFS
ncbi:MAG: hypothetical protein V4494_08075 [Chlamydiota bacterium]